MTDEDTTYFYVNASLLNSQELWPASKATEVNSSTNYTLSFYLANVSFQTNLEEYGNVWYIEFDENGNEQDHGDMVVFNSSDAWTDHPNMFTVSREALTGWAEINVNLTTSSTTKYVKFEPFFQNIRTNAGYSIDNIELVER
ncbi:hypothetical protein HYS31_03310 [Candidatus Woesearchaeota archaeon]|nr:hypothetical protein [Candidatus Woesearchaeota archaeon]